LWKKRKIKRKKKNNCQIPSNEKKIIN
jgi:hypothetical protein